MPDSTHQDAKLLLRGGHTTTLKGIPPHEVEHELRSFVNDHSDEEKGRMIYFQPDNRHSNSIIVNPDDVVAIVGVGDAI